MNRIPDRPISVIYRNSTSGSLQEMTRNLLDTASLKDSLPPDRGCVIGLKPNLVVSQPAERGATTHPEIVEGTIQYLQGLGYSSIVILEGAWVGDSTAKAFSVCGYHRLADTYNVRLIDTQKEIAILKDIALAEDTDTKGYTLKICSIMEQIDFLINMPVLKGHCQTHYTGALKNLKGCIPDSEKRRYHSLGLHEPIARLNRVISQDYIIMDGICGDPTFEEGGSPSSLDRILCSRDPVMLDSYACTLIGLDHSEVPYIGRAGELGCGSLWDGNTDSILEINTSGNKEAVRRDPLLDELAGKIDARDACSSCYAALVGALREYPEIRDHRYAIGRAFRGSSVSLQGLEECMGIGSCTLNFRDFIGGCPPSAEDIADHVLNRPLSR